MFAQRSVGGKMKSRFNFRVFIALSFVVIVASVPAGAWDTKEYHGEGVNDGWQSAYFCLKSKSEECKRNEHEQVSNTALMMVAPKSPWLIGGRTDFYAVALNAELFRPELKGIGKEDYIKAQPGTDLERRLLPPPPHFAGLPDFSYTVYDWANKNQLCPALPENHPDKVNCHVFAAWHGARLNASHFGDQAVMSYKRLHGIAIELAFRAGDLRREAGLHGQATLEAHREAIREAEYLALVYEAAAQHFLGDRWATGHMFDRWGAPEYIAGQYDDPGRAKMAGALTGILHGHESVSGIPDALSSPELDGRHLIIPHWRFPTEEETFPGVGDYRFQDMQDQGFGKEYKWTYKSDWDLSVSVQENWLLGCLAAGYREVIYGFGRNESGYGVDNVEVTDGGFSYQDEKCFSPRVTNEGMLQGWGRTSLTKFVMDDGVAGFSAGRTVLSSFGPSVESRSLLNQMSLGPKERASLTRFSSRLVRMARRNKTGIEMSTSIGKLGDMDTGAAFPIASYFEPEDITQWSKTKDARGKDMQSVFGLFNRAGADFMCGETPRLIEDLRRAKENNNRGMCRILAQRLYKGTAENYEGQQRETPSLDFLGDKTPVEPLCMIASEESVAGDEAPKRLKPGYVGWLDARLAGDNQSEPFSGDEWGVSNQSIANWCDGVPVLDTLSGKFDSDEDIVARVSSESQIIKLTGESLGQKKGRLLLGQNLGVAVEVSDIVRWDEQNIEFRLGEQLSTLVFKNAGFSEEPEARVIYAFIERAAIDDDIELVRKSVGRFAVVDQGPQVVNFKVVQSSDTVLDYSRLQESENLLANGTYRVFEPITPGEGEITIDFDVPIDVNTQSVRVTFGQMSFGATSLSPTRWRAPFSLPEGRDFEVLRGYHPIRVSIKTDMVAYRDIPSAIGDDAGKALFMLLDAHPVHLEEVNIEGPEGIIYQANWRKRLNANQRILTVDTRVPAPSEGNGTLSLTFSGPITESPTVTLGGDTIFLSGNGNSWTGSISFASLAERGVSIHNLVVQAEDIAAKGLDAAPTTEATLDAPPQVTSPIWTSYEASKSGASSESGGADRWHFISTEEVEGPSDLEGIWATSDYGCRYEGGGEGVGLYEEIEITTEGQFVTAVKRTGDSCVGAGEVTWEGTYDRGKIIGQVNGRDPSVSSTFVTEAATVNVVGPDELVLSIDSQTEAFNDLNFKRIKSEVE